MLQLKRRRRERLLQRRIPERRTHSCYDTVTSQPDGVGSVEEAQREAVHESEFLFSFWE